MHDIHCEPKSYKLKLLEKLVIQHGIRALFSGKSSVRTSPLHVYLTNLLSPCARPMKDTHEGGY